MPENIKEIFARNLRYFMERNKINQADICRELKVSSATVSDWCNAEKFPRSDALGQLADLLGIRLSMLVADEGPKEYQAIRDDQDRLEALHQDPRLGLLFDRARRMSEADKETMLAVAASILKERDGDA